MADNNLRSSRSRDPAARDEFGSSAREAAGDPLAELARLIGQGDPYGEGGRQERHSPAQSGDDMPASAVDWAADEAYADEHDRADDRYVPPPAVSYPNLTPQDRVREQDRVQEDELPAAPRFFSGPAPRFNGFREDAADEPRADYAHEPDELPPVSPGRHLPAFASAAHDDYEEAGDPEHDGGQRGRADAAEDYDDDAEKPRRRGGIVVVMAVLGLAVLGTAGAFGYRAMFGGSVLPRLPPIIKAGNGPNKIMPSYGDSQASNSSQTGAATAGSAAHLAPPAEQPVDVQQSVQTPPRVVATIPIVGGPGPVPPGGEMPIGPPPAAAAPDAPAPVFAAPPVSTPTAVAPAPQMAAPVLPAAPAAAPVASEPKRVHTVTIRADQPGGRSASAVSSGRRPSTSAAAGRANEPLSIVPGAAGDLRAPAPEHRHRMAEAAPMSNAEPVTAMAASSGGYAVQVSSQRSEAEAKAAYRMLRAKYPNQFGHREPIIRRADLGAKGIYYRAFVGPFASLEAAAEMCSNLKAAGGNCLIPRN